MKFREIELRLDQTPPLFENEELALRFLLRRKLNKSVIFNLFRDCLTDETVGIERICRLFDQIAIQIKSGGLKNISGTELCLHVFQPLIHEKLISFKTLSEFLLLVCRSLDRQNLEPSDVLVSLLISALVKSDQSILVEQLVLSKIIPITSANACALLRKVFNLIKVLVFMSFQEKGSKDHNSSRVPISLLSTFDHSNWIVSEIFRQSGFSNVPRMTLFN